MVPVRGDADSGGHYAEYIDQRRDLSQDAGPSDDHANQQFSGCHRQAPEQAAAVAAEAELTAQAEQHAQYAASIRAICAAAGVPAAAADFIDSKMALEDVRANLLDLTSTPESSISNASSSMGMGDDQRSSTKASWKAAFKKVEKFNR